MRASATREKLNMLEYLTLKDCPFCLKGFLLRKLCVLLPVNHINNDIFFIFVLSHGKLDLNFFLMAGPKSAKLQHTSEAEIAEKNNYRVLEKYARLVAVTCFSPKVSVAASKLVPRRKKMGS